MRKIYRRDSSQPLRPSQANGYIYYIRLKTSVGYFYKLGFTTLDSVAKRLAYQGLGDEKLLDKTLLFVYLNDAFDVESTLHAHFKGRAAFCGFTPAKHWPLYGNGQSELYVDDILGLDKDYSIEQAHETKRKMHLVERALVESEVERLGGTRALTRMRSLPKDPVLITILRLMRLYERFCLIFASEGDKVRYAASNGRHYEAKIKKSQQIDAIIERLTDLQWEQNIKIRQERNKKVAELMRAAGIEPVSRIDTQRPL